MSILRNIIYHLTIRLVSIRLDTVYWPCNRSNNARVVKLIELEVISRQQHYTSYTENTYLMFRIQTRIKKTPAKDTGFFPSGCHAYGAVDNVLRRKTDRLDCVVEVDRRCEAQQRDVVVGRIRVVRMDGQLVDGEHLRRRLVRVHVMNSEFHQVLISRMIVPDRNSNKD